MIQLNADAIITLVSTVPALCLAALSTWLAYLTLRRRNISRNDVEASVIESIVSRTGIAPQRYVMPYIHPSLTMFKLYSYEL